MHILLQQVLLRHGLDDGRWARVEEEGDGDAIRNARCVHDAVDGVLKVASGKPMHHCASIDDECTLDRVNIDPLVATAGTEHLQARYTAVREDGAQPIVGVRTAREIGSNRCIEVMRLRAASVLRL